VCIESSAGYAAAIAAGVGGAGREAMFEAALVKTVASGGDTDTTAAIAGALVGAALGRDAIPARWIRPVLACRPVVEAGAPRPRPMACWPDDVLELAEALLLANQSL
jgi:ADP-ribosyl-[dinitrogen reductase] hydrolase